MKNKWCLALIVFCVGCLETEIKTDYIVINKKLKKELAEYERLKWYDCYNTIILDAEAYVDTVLLIENLNASLEDGLNFPSRPIRPNHIGFIRLDDTTKKKPILNLLELRRKKYENKDTIQSKNTKK